MKIFVNFFFLKIIEPETFSIEKKEKKKRRCLGFLTCSEEDDSCSSLSSNLVLVAMATG